MNLPNLSKKKKRLISIGILCLVLSIASQGLALSTLISPLLKQYDAIKYVSLLAVLGSVGITVMTPVGGKLGDLYGRKKVVIIAGIACALCNMGVAFASNVFLLSLSRVGIGLAQGTYIATPYIIAGAINEKKDVPKAMGLLATALCVGGFLGSFVAGILTDYGFLKIAVLFPLVPLFIGLILIGICYPTEKQQRNQKLDIIGIVYLTISIAGILFPLNFGTTFGWIHPLILSGFVIGVFGICLLIRQEKKCDAPILPLQIFNYKKYRAFLFVSFICYFYRGAMDVYAPLGVMNILKKGTTLAGALQLPRTIVMLFLPLLAGAWVGKKRERMWTALLITTGFIALPMFMMGFVTQKSSVLMYFIPLTITAVSDSFRGASVTPGAQECLDAQDIGVGTSVINFVNALSGSLAAAFYGLAYDAYVLKDLENVDALTKGIHAVFFLAGSVSLLGFLYVLFRMKTLLKQRVNGCQKDENIL